MATNLISQKVVELNELSVSGESFSDGSAPLQVVRSPLLHLRDLGLGRELSGQRRPGSGAWLCGRVPVHGGCGGCTGPGVIGP